MTDLPKATCSRHVEQILTQALTQGLRAGEKFCQWDTIGGDIYYVGPKGSCAVWACPDKFNTACYTGYSEFYDNREVELLNAAQPRAKKHTTIMFNLRFTSWIIPGVEAGIPA